MVSEWSITPLESIMCKVKFDLLAVTMLKPGSDEQKTVPSVGFTFLASDPAEFTIK